MAINDFIISTLNVSDDMIFRLIHTNHLTNYTS